MNVKPTLEIPGLAACPRRLTLSTPHPQQREKDTRDVTWGELAWACAGTSHSSAQGRAEGRSCLRLACLCSRPSLGGEVCLPECVPGCGRVVDCFLLGLNLLEMLHGNLMHTQMCRAEFGGPVCQGRTWLPTTKWKACVWEAPHSHCDCPGVHV